MQQSRLPLSGAALKNAACLTMFIDHFFALPFAAYIWKCREAGQDVQGLLTVQAAGRAVGRVAFVLFAFLLAEGFVYTRSRSRYIMRLWLFALLSELPFDLTFMGGALEFEHQNVFFTLTTGMCVLTAWEGAGRRARELRGTAGASPGRAARARIWLFRLAQPCALLAGCAAAYLLRADYQHMGVLLIFVFYILRNRPVWERFLPAACVLYLGKFSMAWLDNVTKWDYSYTAGELLQFSLSEMYGLAAFALIALYNGTRGKQLPKWFFYAFYPAHLLFLYAMTVLLFGVTMRVG